MKTKLTFSILIAVIFIAAMVVYKDTLTFEGIIAILISNAGSIVLLWKWLNQIEKTAKTSKELHETKADFYDAMGTTVETYRKIK